MNLQTRKQMAEDDKGGGGGGGGDGKTPAGGAPPAAWYSDTNKDYVATKGWKAGDDAIVSNQNLEKLLGADKAGRAVIWPKDENDADGWKAVRAKLGVPEKPEDYGLQPAEGDADANLIKVASGWFHANGVPKAAAQGLLTEMRKYGAELRKASDDAAAAKGKAELDALNQEWGTAAPQNTEAARRFAKTLGITEEQMSAVEGALGTAAFLKMFHAGGTKLGEHGSGGKSDGSGGVTQMEAQTRLEEARAKRAKGDMNEADWFALSEKLSPIAYPAKAA